MRNRMLRILAGAAGALLLVGPAGVGADTLEVSIHPTTNTDDQQETTPMLGFDGLSNVVVYTHVPNGSLLGDIHYQRVTATGVPMGSSERVSSLSTDDRLNDVSGTYIIYTALDPSDLWSGIIKLYDISNGSTVNLTPAPDTVRDARMHDNIVAWVQGAEGSSSIQMLDLRWPMLSSITVSGSNPAVAVEVGSRYVVWEEFDGISANIMTYDLWLGVDVAVATQSDRDERFPATFGDYVVWQETQDGATSLWARNVTAGTAPFVVANPAGARVRNPSIDNNLIGYESDLSGSFDVYLYRIGEGDTFQVTDGDADEILNYVSGSLVAFVDVSGDLDVAVAHLTFIPDPVDPCAALGGDADADGVCDANDNCPGVANPDQGDADGDGVGDACDVIDVCPGDPADDADGDGVCAPPDNCPTTANADQLDLDGDGDGDACDACPLDSANDADGDGVCLLADNCPNAANADQADADADGIGDACDDDAPQCGPVSGLLRDLSVGHIRTVAGNDIVGWSGDGGPATAAGLSLPHDVFVDDAGNLYIGDSGNQRVRRVEGQTGIITTVAGSGVVGSAGDGGLATAAQLNDPRFVTTDAAGNVFIAESVGHRVRRVDAATGIITTVAGGGPSSIGDGTTAADVALLVPSGMAFDARGNLFVVETGWDRVLRIDAGADGIVTGATDEIVSIVAGRAGGGFGGDGGPANAALFANPEDIAFDPGGSLLVVDRVNNRIRLVTTGADAEITGEDDEIVSTVAGGGAAAGDGAAAVNAALNLPRGIAVDRSGNVFISEANALRVRRVDAVTGIITTAAGGGTANGEDIPATTAQLFTSRGIATDRDGNLFIALIRGVIRAVRLAPQGAPDTTPPVLQVPADIVTNATHPGGAVVAHVATANDAECGLASFSCAPASGSVFPVGVTRVTCSATDLAGNSSAAEFSVTVRGAAEQIVDLLERLRHMPFSALLKARLIVVLRSALADPHNVGVTCEILRIFIARVQQSSSRYIPPELASELINDATRIRAVLGC